MLPKPGTDLPPLTPQVDLQDQQLVGIRVGGAFENGRDAQLELGEVVVLDHVGRRRGAFHVALSLGCGERPTVYARRGSSPSRSTTTGRRSRHILPRNPRRTVRPPRVGW